ncbi:MAG: OmpH family outer membrane protein [Alphaproteobacteria bacterium]|mgnify:FL=1|jgi:Skp family chaperone for outer membrane proteins|nr:OmpH family outer membrane protein [Alphaproteobacteria bacterium]MDP7191639.1 OmpH family outer membrane protein [Alphaproteobacteria bacterium]HJO88315.1 OmpH family outer membrane protein [Alphaproteobacteria bacterium]|tara:strand:- start:996 stop:1577 length:582 start_codon:yes stop_codon:yes gene_type:complete
MIKFFSLGAAFTLALAASGLLVSAYAEDKGPIPAPTIALINAQKIMKESLAAQSLLEQVDKVHRKERDKIAALEDSLRDERQKIDRQRTVLTTEKYQEKVREWENKSGEHIREAEKRKRALDIALNRSLAQIKNALYVIIQDISENRGINLVFNKLQFFFGDPEMDITEEALVQLNKDLKTVKLPSIDETAGK